MYTYSSLITALSTETAIPSTDANFIAILPTIIDQAEQYLYRELDLLTSIVTITITSVIDTRKQVLPTTSGTGSTIHFLVVDSINFLDSNKNRYPLTPSTREVIDFMFPNDLYQYVPSIPELFCRSDDTSIMVGPSPDQTYQFETIGTIRPDPLSSTNTQTYLSMYLSDLFFTACMVEMTGYLQNFGQQSDNPQMATSWATLLAAKLSSAKDEELRKSYVTAMSAPPVSQRDA